MGSRKLDHDLELIFLKSEPLILERNEALRLLSVLHSNLAITMAMRSYQLLLPLEP